MPDTKNSTTTSPNPNPQKWSNPPGWEDWMSFAGPAGTYQEREELIRRLNIAEEENRRMEEQEREKLAQNQRKER